MTLRRYGFMSPGFTREGSCTRAGPTGKRSLAFSMRQGLLFSTNRLDRAVRPAYAKLGEGCSDGPSRASMHRGRTMGKHRLAFVAFDSARNKHAAAIADDGRDGEVRYLGEIDNSPDAVRKLVAKLSRQYERLHFCYEAGPTGYGLHRSSSTSGSAIAWTSCIQSRAE